MSTTGAVGRRLGSPPADEALDADAGDGIDMGRGIDMSRAIALVLALVGFVVGARVISDNSFLTHLATGIRILETSSVPTIDPYSYTATGERWTVQSWLVSLGYASLDAGIGGWAIRLVHGAVGAAVIAAMWRLVAPAKQLVTRVALVGLVLLIGTYLWPPRPLLVGLLATVAVLHVVQGHRSHRWLIPVFWLWVNAHGSFVLGFGLVGAVAVGAAIDQRRLPREELRNLGFAALGCAVAAVNPLGWRLLWFPFHMMSRREALDRVSEWASPSFRAPVEQLFLLLLVLVVVAAVRGARWRALVPALAFLVGGLLAVRNLGLASLVIVAMVAPSLEGMVGTVDGSLRGRLPRMIAFVAAAGLVVASLAIVSTAPVDLDDYPVAEVDWLDERSLVADPDVRLAQRDYVGNYLTLRYGPEARVFMDDRFDFYPLPVIEDHNGLLLGGDYDEIMGRNEFDVVLWATDSPFRRWIDSASEWTVAVDGDDWFVACRRTSPVFTRCTR